MAGDANRISQVVSGSYFIYGGENFPCVLVSHVLTWSCTAPFEIIIASIFLYQYVRTFSENLKCIDNTVAAQVAWNLGVRWILRAVDRMAPQQLRREASSEDSQGCLHRSG